MMTGGIQGIDKHSWGDGSSPEYGDIVTIGNEHAGVIVSFGTDRNNAETTFVVQASYSSGQVELTPLSVFVANPGNQPVYYGHP